MTSREQFITEQLRRAMALAAEAEDSTLVLVDVRKPCLDGAALSMRFGSLSEGELFQLQRILADRLVAARDRVISLQMELACACPSN